MIFWYQSINKLQSCIFDLFMKSLFEIEIEAKYLACIIHQLKFIIHSSITNTLSNFSIIIIANLFIEF